jgi:hypothetical protein
MSNTVRNDLKKHKKTTNSSTYITQNTFGGTKATAYGRGRLLGCFRDTLALFDGLGWVLKKQKNVNRP